MIPCWYMNFLFLNFNWCLISSNRFEKQQLFMDIKSRWARSQCFNFNYTFRMWCIPLDFHFTESKISKTVIINTTITALEWSGSLHAHSVPRSRAIVLGKIRTKRLKLMCWRICMWKYKISFKKCLSLKYYKFKII